jgi:hypothetical protein
MMAGEPIVGVIWRGCSYRRGYGITDVSNPQPVNADTLFRPASISKTFTGTAAMRLVDQGRLVLHRRVDSYADGFVAPAGAQSVMQRSFDSRTLSRLVQEGRSNRRYRRVARPSRLPSSALQTPAIWAAAIGYHRRSFPKRTAAIVARQAFQDPVRV